MIRSIILYGLTVAVILLVFKGAEYYFYSKQISIEVYVSILALMFTGIGVWFGLKYTKPETIVEHQIVENIDAGRLLIFGISEREIEILHLVVSGRTNQQIADELFISLSTVKTHLQNTFQKLDVRNRIQAIQKAKEISVSPT